MAQLLDPWRGNLKCRGEARMKLLDALALNVLELMSAGRPMDRCDSPHRNCGVASAGH